MFIWGQSEVKTAQLILVGLEPKKSKAECEGLDLKNLAFLEFHSMEGLDQKGLAYSLTNDSWQYNQFVNKATAKSFAALNSIREQNIIFLYE